MKGLSLTRVIARRIADDWKLLSTVFAGIVIATTIGAATPIYLESLDQLSFNAALDRLDRPKIDVFGAKIVSTQRDIDRADGIVRDAIDNHLADVYVGHNRYLKSRLAIIGTPNYPLPVGSGEGILVSRGFLQHISRLSEYVRLVEGRMPTDDIDSSPYGPKIEVVVSSDNAERFGLEIDTSVILSKELISQRAVSSDPTGGAGEDGLDDFYESSPAPVPAGPPSVTALVVGVFEALDADDNVWGENGEALAPAAIDSPPPFLATQKPGEAPLALFAEEIALRYALQDLIESVTFTGRETYVKGQPMLVDAPADPLPLSTGKGLIARLGFFAALSNIEDHITFESGGMAGTSIEQGPRGPIIEVIAHRDIAVRTETSVGVELHFSPEYGQREVITARIVGFYDEVDDSSPYWRATGPLLSLNPARQDAPLLVEDDDSLSTIPLIVHPSVMARALTMAYPGAVIASQWGIDLDAEQLKKWTAAEARERFRAFSDEVIAEFPEANANTEFVENLTLSGQLRDFFAKIPMLLLLTVILLTTLFFLGILVSYLTESRQDDSSLLKTLGASLTQLTRVYALEGGVMALIAVAAAPFLSYAMVALSGALPWFEEMNSGALMPVRISAAPFIIAGAVGLFCLAIFIVPNVLSAQGGTLLRRRQASRPLGQPWLQRYNVDVGILVFGGLFYWELQKRGQFLSAGLFGETEVNEALLAAPVLFLIVAALAFMRFFPMIVRYVSGESLRVVDLLTAASALAAAAAVYWRERGTDVTDWLPPVALALGVLAAYALTRYRWGALRYRLGGLAAQIALVAAFAALRPPVFGELLDAPTWALIAAPPAQALFMAFAALSRVWPVAIQVALLHMSRNPMQYTWLILLLVLATGLSVLATTVGGTLERSQYERILFEEGADLRVSASVLAAGGIAEVYRKSKEIEDVERVVLGLRTGGQTIGGSAQVFGLDTDAFADVAWYRDDFSASSLPELMDKLKPDSESGRIAIPDDANGIGMWVKTEPFIPGLDLYFQFEDKRGELQTVVLNELMESGDWQFLFANIPDTIKPPWWLASIHMFEPGADNQAGLTGSPVTPGKLYFDDALVTVGSESRDLILDDFEGERLQWEAILTSAASTESVEFTTSQARSGAQSIVYAFSGQTTEGLRGLYPIDSPGPLPVAINATLAAGGLQVGNVFIAKVDHRWIRMRVVEIVDYFPTHDPRQGALIISDLNSLVERSNVLLGHLRLRPLDLYFDLQPGSHEQVGEQMVDILGPQGGSVHDGQGRLEALRLNPFVSAGWRPMTILAPAIAVFAIAVGYVTYLLLFAKRSAVEIGSLRTLGLTRAQLLILLGLEHLAAAAIGLGLGTWAGFQMSRLTVAPLAITESGQPVAPPFILTTDWAIMGVTYAAFAAVLIAALFALNRGIGKLDLRAVSRFGE